MGLEYLRIHEWHNFMEHVGKCSSPMEHLGISGNTQHQGKITTKAIWATWISHGWIHQTSIYCIGGKTWRRGNLFILKHSMYCWLVVSTHLKNISQIGNLPEVEVNIKNIWNHHLDGIFTQIYHSRLDSQMYTPEIWNPKSGRFVDRFPFNLWAFSSSSRFQKVQVNTP